MDLNMDGDVAQQFFQLTEGNPALLATFLESAQENAAALRSSLLTTYITCEFDNNNNLRVLPEEGYAVPDPMLVQTYKCWIDIIRAIESLFNNIPSYERFNY